MSEAEFFKILIHISTPLGIVSLALGIVFLIFREITKRNIFPKLNQQFSADVLILIINRLFLLALFSIVLGFTAFMFPKFINNYSISNQILASLPLGEPYSFGESGVTAKYLSKKNGANFVLVLPSGNEVRGVATPGYKYEFNNQRRSFVFIVNEVTDNFLGVTLQEK